MKTIFFLSFYYFIFLKKKAINFNGLIADLDDAEPESIILLHACAHNPTGIDLTPEQWKQLKDLMLKKKHLAFFDLGFQVTFFFLSCFFFLKIFVFIVVLLPSLRFFFIFISFLLPFISIFFFCSSFFFLSYFSFFLFLMGRFYYNYKF